MLHFRIPRAAGHWARHDPRTVELVATVHHRSRFLVPVRNQAQGRSRGHRDLRPDTFRALSKPPRGCHSSFTLAALITSAFAAESVTRKADICAGVCSGTITLISLMRFFM